MNLIQENTDSITFFTSLRNIEQWLEISLDDFDFHFTDVSGGWSEIKSPMWITGEDLNLIIKEFDYQFEWAVISVYPKGTTPKLSDKPYADGNPNFWSGSPKKQLKDSIFEIICWDSTATLFIQLPHELAQKLLKNAPGISDLDQQNKKVSKKS
ncbi:hypothetical protein U8527_05675 [Kordia algicida OT-1]|uniref:Uncharacterized protein n=1 Tax=Kordia algicida OT-1 TaxID=391587 RepID=A9DMY5_9FLAO|nr:hypothetical protein [Kordia algicida]EDP97816.1 hypothetical protein KAOT1_21677 [Kordia algicida OT-1]